MYLEEAKPAPKLSKHTVVYVLSNSQLKPNI